MDESLYIYHGVACNTNGLHRKSYVIRRPGASRVAWETRNRIVSDNDKTKQRGVTRVRGVSNSRKRERDSTVKRIRSILNRTQGELAAALGISEKAVQSYEQGWRAVPARVLIQLLVLLALYRKQTMDDVPCWEIRQCPPDRRNACASFTVGRGQFCWLIGTTACRPRSKKTPDLLLPCMECAVVRRLLSGWRPMGQWEKRPK